MNIPLFRQFSETYASISVVASRMDNNWHNLPKDRHNSFSLPDGVVSFNYLSVLNQRLDVSNCIASWCYCLFSPIDCIIIAPVCLISVAVVFVNLLDLQLHFSS